MKGHTFSEYFAERNRIFVDSEYKKNCLAAFTETKLEWQQYWKVNTAPSVSACHSDATISRSQCIPNQDLRLIIRWSMSRSSRRVNSSQHSNHPAQADSKHFDLFIVYVWTHIGSKKWFDCSETTKSECSCEFCIWLQWPEWIYPPTSCLRPYVHICTPPVTTSYDVGHNLEKWHGSIYFSSVA